MAARFWSILTTTRSPNNEHLRQGGAYHWAGHRRRGGGLHLLLAVQELRPGGGKRPQVFVVPIRPVRAASRRKKMTNRVP